MTGYRAGSMPPPITGTVLAANTWTRTKNKRFDSGKNRQQSAPAKHAGFRSFLSRSYDLSTEEYRLTLTVGQFLGDVCGHALRDDRMTQMSAVSPCCATAPI
jgi:hypothetical protein